MDITTLLFEEIEMIISPPDGIIAQRLSNFETKTAETICIEITIYGRKWLIVFAYRPESINRKLFFDELNTCLLRAASKYDLILLAGDLNVDMDIPKKDTKGFFILCLRYL